MAEPVYREISFPKMPDDISDELRDYLINLERLLTDMFLGSRQISGDLNLGGRIYARDASGVNTKLFEDGIIGN